MLILVRHGNTALNDDKDGERMRGWANVPLNDHGEGAAIETATMLHQLPIKSVYSSDLTRAVQTASAISEATGIPNQPTFALRDWNIGDLTGAKVQDALPITFKHLENPDVPIPNGESYAQYVKRVVPALHKLVEDPDLHVAVSHNRTLTLAEALAKQGGKGFDINDLKKKGPVEPGGFIVISPGWNIIDKHSPEDKDARSA